MSEWEKFLGVSQVTAVSLVAAVIFGEDRQCWSVPWQVTGERSFFSASRVLQKGINVLHPLIGLCVAELLGGRYWFARENKSVTATKYSLGKKRFSFFFHFCTSIKNCVDKNLLLLYYEKTWLPKKIDFFCYYSSFICLFMFGSYISFSFLLLPVKKTPTQASCHFSWEMVEFCVGSLRKNIYMKPEVRKNICKDEISTHPDQIRKEKKKKKK